MRTKKPTWTPNDPVPPYADRNTIAAIISHHLFPVSPRTIATWPLTISRPNRSAIYEVKEALDYAKRKLREAVCYKQGGGSMNILQNKIAPLPPGDRESVPGQVYDTHRETSDSYGDVIAVLTSRWRVATCKNGIQWILQKRTAEPLHEGIGRGQSYCTSRDALLEACASRELLSDKKACTFLNALPEKIKVGRP